MEKVTALVPVRQDYALALEPTNINEAFELAKMACTSGMIPRAIQRPEQAMMVLMRGRELGLTAMQSFASLHVIDGKVVMSAELIVGKVKQRRDVCKFFTFVSGDDTQATFEALREGNPRPTRLTFTIEQARTLGLTGKDNWKKQPANMLRWRCATALARLEFPELTLGLYSPDEAEDMAGGHDVDTAPQLITEPVRLADPAPETLEGAMKRWKASLFVAATPADCDAVAKDMAGRLVKETPEHAEMTKAYKTRKAELKKAPATPPAEQPHEGEIVDGASETRQPGEDG